MTTIREAILKTADLFEREPNKYNFMCDLVPFKKECGCAIGHIGAFLGGQTHRHIDCLQPLIGVYQSEFYDRMRAIQQPFKGDRTWHYDAELCAQCLRIYADTFHPEASGELPESITRIFEVQHATP